MKKIGPFLLAAALAAPALGLAASHAGAQPGNGQAPSAERGDRGPRGDHGPRGEHHRRDPAAHVEHRARMLTAILDLDAHQAAEVRRILTRTATEMEALMQQPRSDATHASMRALHERSKAEIDALLNPSQRATMDRMEAVRGEHHGHGDDHQGGPRGPREGGPRGPGRRDAQRRH